MAPLNGLRSAGTVPRPLQARPAGYTPATPRWQRDRTGQRQGYYGQLVWHFLDETSDASQGLREWVRAGKASDDTFKFDRYLSGGLDYIGFF